MHAGHELLFLVRTIVWFTLVRAADYFCIGTCKNITYLKTNFFKMLAHNLITSLTANGFLLLTNEFIEVRRQLFALCHGTKAEFCTKVLAVARRLFSSL